MSAEEDSVRCATYDDRLHPADLRWAARVQHGGASHNVDMGAFEYGVGLGGFASGQCAGDLNDDGDVDALDVLVLLGEFGTCSGTCLADLNDDGIVSADDLWLLLRLWGACD
jgi:hypothetical protein